MMTVERDEDRSTLEQMEWALAYNAYERLAAAPEDLECLLGPARENFRTTGRVPGWCGVDLLRGWAFHLARADHFAGGGTLGEEWRAVLSAVREHPAARRRDRPPTGI